LRWEAPGGDGACGGAEGQRRRAAAASAIVLRSPLFEWMNECGAARAVRHNRVSVRPAVITVHVTFDGLDADMVVRGPCRSHRAGDARTHSTHAIMGWADGKFGTMGWADGSVARH
jgi:hypothetical protein